MEIAYYAGAADAAGTESEHLDAADTTAAELVALLGARHSQLAGVLPVCSLLVDGSPVKDPNALVPAQSRVDVLPPFAGG
jgi:sulfur-carrier protein